MPFISISMRKSYLGGGGKGQLNREHSQSFRYNKGNKVLGLEFGDHIGDW